MSDRNLAARLRQRYQTAALWTSGNPVLLAGEMGFESDTGQSKIGDGATAWNSLSYLPTSSFVLPAGGLAGQVLVSDGSGGCAWAWPGDNAVYIP